MHPTAWDATNTKDSAKPKSTKLKWKEAKELESIEQDISRAEAEVRRIEGIFSSQDFYETHGDRTAQLAKDLTAARGTVDRLYERWHELEELRSGTKSG